MTVQLVSNRTAAENRWQGRVDGAGSVFGMRRTRNKVVNQRISNMDFMATEDVLILTGQNKMEMPEIDFSSRFAARPALPVQGFTLLELLVVMVIIGLLAGYVGPKYFAQIGKSEIKVARAQIDSLDKSLDQYRLDTGHYPSMEDGLAALVARPANEPRWDGPYLKKNVPQDPWGNPYVYRIPGEHSEYDLLSYGKDGQPGGEGEAADITNW